MSIQCLTKSEKSLEEKCLSVESQVSLLHREQWKQWCLAVDT